MNIHEKMRLNFHRYVETLGKNPTEASEPGEGFGQARFGFLIILFLVVNKFQYLGLIPLPAGESILFYCVFQQN